MPLPSGCSLAPLRAWKKKQPRHTRHILSKLKGVRLTVKTSDSIKRLKAGPPGHVMHWLFLIAFVFPIGCASKKFPTKTLYEYDSAAGACGVYEIVDFENLRFEYVRDIPLHECPSIFGFTSGVIPEILDWAKDRVNEEINCNQKE